MSSDKPKTSDFPAVGASGAIGILPNGYFAKILSGPAPPSPPPPAPPQPQRGAWQSRDTLPDRG
jgi:hypothetical protein